MKPKFGNDLTNVILRQSQVVQTRMAGRAVIKVVNRCNDAKENNSLSYNTPEDVEEKLVDPGMWRIFQRSLKLQIKESFYKTILRRRPRGDHNARDTSDETGTRDPLNNLMDTKDTKDNEIDGNGVV
ncbi:hypothetical protein E2C01_006428 [Portunus trituberculatus]|uniref:Uncharacterized protein n=1 Tax=Portunus trituberculatus TaxID=210409 RepID=A0A5B7CXB9_PORTR|nr:hypothetical protein [Portunus trituberculatus]